MEELVFKAYREGGLILVLVIVLCVISFLIIRHILRQNDKVLSIALNKFTEMNEKWQKVTDEHISQAREYHNTVNQAHDYQRREHERMINNLDEQAKVLARINGFKHE